jgi:hypothetical protein
MNVLFLFIVIQIGADFECKIARTVNKSTPSFATFPPSVIGGIGSKYQQHRQGKTHQGMNISGVFKRQVKNFHLRINYDCCVNSNTNNSWQSDSKGITLVKTKNQLPPIFGIINYHTTKINGLSLKTKAKF